MKRVLLNILTHGDELVGKRVADEIASRHPALMGNGLDIQIANAAAHEKGKRYVEQDLNRVFPGVKEGSLEEKRAYELAPVISTYGLVIDVHSTESGSGDMVIVTKMDADTVKCLRSLAPKYVLYMNIKPDTSLISCAKIGIALEMGSDKDPATFTKTVTAVEHLVSMFGLIPSRPPFGYVPDSYEVVRQVTKPTGAQLEEGIRNFKFIKKGEVYAKTSDGQAILADEDFYPILFGNTNYETIFGFAALELSL